jgi:general secretion pathway protein D
VAAWSDEGGPAAIDFLNGLLIVTQTRKGHERLSDLLEQLRRERAIMISVEARFVTVSDDFLQDITLDVDVALYNGTSSPLVAGFGNGASGATAPTTSPYPTLPGAATGAQVNQPISIFQTGSNGVGTATLLSKAGSAFANFTANEGGMLVSGVFLDDIQVGFLLRAIQADVRSTQLQAPRITMYNGQRSYITATTVRTYISDATPVVGTAAVGWDITVGAVPIGMTLDVRATVSADRRYVQMDLRPQMAAAPAADFRKIVVTAATPGTGTVEGAGGIATAYVELPVVTIQDFKTTVSVPDGGTLLLGGTKELAEQEAETGVPFLSKIPILKRLFNNRASLRTNKNLLILIRPKIILQAEEEHKLGYDNF